MRCPILVAALLGLAGLAACNPTFNWREVRADNSSLVALLPCKPDRGTRTVPLAGRPTELQMVGCESGGATFALARADLPDAAQVGSTLAQWRVITLANARASVTGQAAPFVPRGAMALPESVLVAAPGQQPDGSPVQLRAAWFAQATGAGVQVFQALVVSRQMPVEASETFFSGLKLQQP
jgi:hypothetical protein